MRGLGGEQLFPYHLAENVCRVQRVSPFRYYIEMLYEVMKNGKGPIYNITCVTLTYDVCSLLVCNFSMGMFIPICAKVCGI
jgi:hypothetical protein